MAGLRAVPNLKCTSPSASAEFYSSVLGLHVAMDQGWGS